MTGILLFVLAACNNKSQEHELNTQLMIKNDSLKTLLSYIDTLKQITKGSIENEDYLFDDDDIEMLKQQGINDPEHDIINDLLSKPGFIPYPGELGRTMKLEYCCFNTT